MTVASSEYKILTEEGLKYVYRVGDMGDVQQQLDDGSWKTISPSTGNKKRVYIRFRRKDGKRMYVPLVRLMDKYFFNGYAKKHNLCITHKNGMKTDCSKYNLVFKTVENLSRNNSNSSQRVCKLNCKGDIIAIYKSVKEAALSNYMSTSAMSARVRNKVLHKYDIDGCYYMFEKEYDKKCESIK